jgi:hypothetical protein
MEKYHLMEKYQIVMEKYRQPVTTPETEMAQETIGRQDVVRHNAPRAHMRCSTTGTTKVQG